MSGGKQGAGGAPQRKPLEVNGQILALEYIYAPMMVYQQSPVREGLLFWEFRGISWSDLSSMSNRTKKDAYLLGPSGLSEWYRAIVPGGETKPG